MSVVIKGFNKPQNCFGCSFNHSDCWCAITEGGIDRDDYSCDLPCPIKPLDDNVTNGDVLEQIFKFQNDVLGKIKAEISVLSDSKCEGNSVTIYSWSYMQRKVLDIIDKYKTPHWIERRLSMGIHDWTCSVCKCQHEAPIKICPNCGADTGGRYEMAGESE